MAKLFSFSSRFCPLSPKSTKLRIENTDLAILILQLISWGTASLPRVVKSISTHSPSICTRRSRSPKYWINRMSTNTRRRKRCRSYKHMKIGFRAVYCAMLVARMISLVVYSLKDLWTDICPISAFHAIDITSVFKLK